MLRSLVVTASLFLAVSPAFAARAAKPAADKKARAKPATKLAATSELVMHFETNDGYRRATHAVPMSQAESITTHDRGATITLQVNGHALTTKSIRYTGPKGELAKKEIPPAIVLDGVSGETLQAAVARQAGLKITPMAPAAPSREMLQSARLHLVDERTILSFSFNPDFFARNVGERLEVPLSELARVNPGGLGYYVQPKGSAPIPNRERSLSLPWASSFGSDGIANIYRVMDSEVQLPQKAIDAYVSGRADSLRFERSYGSGKSGSEMANALRARLVRHLTETGVQSVEWLELKDEDARSSAKKQWGL